ncbi:MAG: acyltransferase, partial [Flavobacteriales bacterium]|nr:acyltransferase [Flavobacteriales bacterium]
MEQILEKNTKQRIYYIDLLRLIAIFLVICVHCCDPFNVSEQARTDENYRFWGMLYGSFLRPCVPLFVMMTGLLLLPIKEKTNDFWKKRIPRLLVPFLIWCVLYNIFPCLMGGFGYTSSVINDFFGYAGHNPSQTFESAWHYIMLIPVQFSKYDVHMWYIYTLIGLYLFMPFLSAWVEKTDRKTERIFLGIWCLTLFLPYVYEFYSRYVLGECAWNSFGLLYYFAGFQGYLVLGHFLKKGNDMSVAKTALWSLVLFAVGYAVTFIGFKDMMGNPKSTEEQIELFFTYCSPNVMMMTLAIFLLVQKVKITAQWTKTTLANLTKCGFGIYMCHYILVGPVFGIIKMMDIPTYMMIPLASVGVLASAWAVV